MKSYILTIALSLMAHLSLNAQGGPVCTFNYQAVVRDAGNNIIPNRTITVRLSVLGGAGGTAFYIEEHSTSTNSLGLITLEVGAGAKVGGTLDWMAIPWVVDRLFLKVEADINGGQSFEVLGESPILAVPIAIQAKIAAFAYQTIDTMTKIVQTLCADTLKGKFSCLDTLKSFYGHIDTLIILKAYVTDLCVDTIKIVTEDGPIPFAYEDPDFPGEVLVNFDYMQGYVVADTIDALKIVANDVCAGKISLVDKILGETYPVLKLDIAESSTSLCVDQITGEVMMDTVKAESMCIDSFLYVKDANGEVIFWADYLGADNPLSNAHVGVVGEFYADTMTGIKMFADEMCGGKVIANEVEIRNGIGEPIGYLGDFEGTGTLDIEKVFADSICTEDIISQGLTFVDDLGETQDVLYYDPIFTGINLDVTKVITREACTNSIEFLDEEGEQAGSVQVNNIGESALFIDKIYAGDICTNGLLIQTPEGEPLFNVNPNADPQTEYGFIFNHNIMVNGGLLAEFKQFVIDHPLDPDNKTLSHFSIESDQMLNVYAGTTTFNENGEAWIQLPDWFEALNKDFTYQLTCIGGFANVYIADEIMDNRFRIAGGNDKIKVSWQVSGVRHDRQALEQDLPVERWK